MGTTLVAALVDSTQHKLYAINVGDSRLYKLDAAAIRQVTKDHSLVQRLIDSGQLTPAEARHHPNANLIYRTLGERANIEIDTFEQTLAPGETLLLCTDGLCGLVDDDELHRVVTTASTPPAACARLVELAKAAGGHDNITVIVVAVAADN
jgi:protein phosphatase